MSRRAATDETALARIARRLVTIPLYVALAALAVALAPLWLPALALHDALRSNRWSGVRSALALTHYLIGEALGLAVSALLVPLAWVAPERAAEANFRLQCWWARWLFGGAARIFELAIEARNIELLRAGPALVLMRHASVIDTLLPAAIVSSRTGLRLRYVMKRELLWDPCLDVVGQRLPNAFVRRGRGGAEEEIARVRELARDLGPRDGVLLYPEGTRFTPARREQALARLAATSDPKLVERAHALRHVLPPRLGGALALLESAPGADVVIGAHTGLESLRTLNQLWSGALVGQRIELEFWRIAAADVPRAREERIEWIYDQWQRVDAWLAARLEREVPAT
jgi:1-acyl-sn-glycerol-3-phosphate acyltransferase